ncbi:MAG: ATP-binding protein, partial [Pseudonocardia sp.]|nr:ATP-binding protein [Pseudonocardia sp.]
DEQTALRRVAELVARGAPLPDVFTAVETEASRLLGDHAEARLRHDPEGDTAVGAGVTVPIVVEGRLWRTLTTSTAGPQPTPGTDDRLLPFAELAAAAIANAENKDKLTASRARVIATADETRRRVQRDVHDGAQQRLVHTIIALKTARHRMPSGSEAASLVAEAQNHAELALRELRDLVQGLLPAALARGGLGAGVDSLVSDLPLPAEVDFAVPRLPVALETTAYFVIAEALTNVVKHAHASRIRIRVTLEAGALVVEVHDDGSGGADPTRGTGLTGLLDRVEAGNGTLTIDSPAGAGTAVRATLPVGAVP